MMNVHAKAKGATNISTRLPSTQQSPLLGRALHPQTVPGRTSSYQVRSMHRISPEKVINGVVRKLTYVLKQGIRHFKRVLFRHVYTTTPMCCTLLTLHGVNLAGLVRFPFLRRYSRTTSISFPSLKGKRILRNLTKWTRFVSSQFCRTFKRSRNVPSISVGSKNLIEGGDFAKKL